MFFDVNDAQYLEDYRIALRFADGSAGVVDVSGYPDKDTVFRSFQDMSYFRSFRLQYGVLVWGDGELDIAPQTLYAMATGRTVSYERSWDQAVQPISHVVAVEHGHGADRGSDVAAVIGSA